MRLPCTATPNPQFRRRVQNVLAGSPHVAPVAFRPCTPSALFPLPSRHRAGREHRLADIPPVHADARQQSPVAVSDAPGRFIVHQPHAPAAPPLRAVGMPARGFQAPVPGSNATTEATNGPQPLDEVWPPMT